MHGVAEELQVVRDIMLARLTGARVHICHISCSDALNAVREAKANGLSVTCEVTPHHFTLSDESVRSYSPDYRMNPPLRTRKDVEAMIAGIADGSIDCIATDHAPHAPIDKDLPFEDAANGVIGLETSVPLVWEHLVRKGVISISRMVELMSVNPSRILGLDRGTLKPGSVADVTVIDPDKEITIDSSEFESKARNCPFDGWTLHGAPVLTVVKGRVVWNQLA
jgi:dihydroorotase